MSPFGVDLVDSLLEVLLPTPRRTQTEPSTADDRREEDAFAHWITMQPRSAVTPGRLVHTLDTRYPRLLTRALQHPTLRSTVIALLT
jgi:hypothetical protein